ncbi:hypothetical protein [Actinacidiphila yeochonensis]|uniref:hypothetical protein n=1 Tax=Actinacidiphila yeochonensis TaxID=89050 RepID=UPI0012FEE434|nr:hypothetical protein [Actinacidiphila yeochonensis]
MQRGDFPTTASRPPAGAAAHPVPARDREWPHRMRTAYASSVSVLALALVFDGWDGSLTWWRALLWTALAATLFAILLPPRTTAGEGWLAVRGLLHTERVRTDRLVSARLMGTVDRRLILRDASGALASVDVTVLIANPFLWHELDSGARRAHAAGLLPDRGALNELAKAVDADEARRLLSSAGLS